MPKTITTIFLLFAWSACLDSKELSEPVVLDQEVRTLNGQQTVTLADAYKGKVMLIVNTASKCAFTGQYEGLEALYSKYRDDGLVVLGFPSNDFGKQEPGTEEQVQEFCRMTYGVQFPMFEKYRVRKKNAGPVYKVLGDAAGQYPKWNFHKYLVDRDGNLVASYGSFVKPQSRKLVRKIEAVLLDGKKQ